MFSEQFLEVQTKRVRWGRAHFGHAIHVVRVRPREAGARYYSVWVAMCQDYRLVALDL